MDFLIYILCVSVHFEQTWLKPDSNFAYVILLLSQCFFVSDFPYNFWSVKSYNALIWSNNSNNIYSTSQTYAFDFL